MQGLAANADAGRAALTARDRAAFLACVDRNFDLRAAVFPIAAADRALIELGRSLGAAAKFPGSGGAVLFACRDGDHRDRVDAACRALGHTTLRPTVQRPVSRLGAVFLAAGFATRLYPLTKDRAKPLLEVGGQPLLTRIVRQVERAGGVTAGIVVTNARFHGDFVRWLADARPRLPLQLVDDGATTDASRLGAVRDLALALDRHAAAAQGADAPDGFLVLACDNLFEFDLAALAERFAASGRAQLVVREVPPPVPAGRYSEVILDGDRVASFREKPADPRSPLSAIAVYLLPPELPQLVRDYLAGGGEPDAPGHFIAWLCARRPLGAVRLSGRWLDIGSADDLRRATGW
jgi:glucose-1-phosphate thymidylyltransferase